MIGHRYMWMLAFIMVQLLLSTHMFAHSQPRRPHFAIRVVVSCAVSLALAALIAQLGYSRLTSMGVDFYVAELLVFCCYFGMMVCCSLFCYDISIWAALFCCTAAYTVQNLSSGLDSALETTAVSFGLFTNVPAIVFLVITTVIVYVPCYHLFASKIGRAGVIDLTDRKLLLLVAAVILIDIAFNQRITMLADNGLAFTDFLVLRLAHATACIFTLVVEVEMLYANKLEKDMLVIDRMAKERERQYEMSRDNIDAINIKCHDLRHQIHDLARGEQTVDRAALDDIAREVDIYDSKVKTGNEALDTVLTEKSLLCEREGITLSVVADGKALAGMPPADIYSLFGNAIDNAVEAVRDLPERDKRSVSLTVRSLGSVVSVHVENYFSPVRDEDAGSPTQGLTFRDGLPLTTKSDISNHGFGMRSMRLVAERYGGTLTATVNGETFSLDVILPSPKAAA